MGLLPAGPTGGCLPTRSPLAPLQQSMENKIRLKANIYKQRRKKIEQRTSNIFSSSRLFSKGQAPFSLLLCPLSISFQEVMSTVMWTEEENKAEKPERDSANLSHSQMRRRARVPRFRLKQYLSPESPPPSPARLCTGSCAAVCQGRTTRPQTPEQRHVHATWGSAMVSKPRDKSTTSC